MLEILNFPTGIIFNALHNSCFLLFYIHYSDRVQETANKLAMDNTFFFAFSHTMTQAKPMTEVFFLYLIPLTI